MFGIKNKKSVPMVTIWDKAPHFPTPAQPSVIYHEDELYMGLDTLNNDEYSVVLFLNVIEYIIQPFANESLGKHKYYKYGLEQYQFNIINNSPKVEEWALLKPKHWVITFGDETHDVLSEKCIVLGENIKAKS